MTNTVRKTGMITNEVSIFFLKKKGLLWIKLGIVKFFSWSTDMLFLQQKLFYYPKPENEEPLPKGGRIVNKTFLNFKMCSHLTLGTCNIACLHKPLLYNESDLTII